MKLDMQMMNKTKEKVRYFLDMCMSGIAVKMAMLRRVLGIAPRKWKGQRIVSAESVGMNGLRITYGPLEDEDVKDSRKC